MLFTGSGRQPRANLQHIATDDSVAVVRSPKTWICPPPTFQAVNAFRNASNQHPSSPSGAEDGCHRRTPSAIAHGGLIPRGGRGGPPFRPPLGPAVPISGRTVTPGTRGRGGARGRGRAMPQHPGMMMGRRPRGSMRGGRFVVQNFVEEQPRICPTTTDEGIDKFHHASNERPSSASGAELWHFRRPPSAMEQRPSTAHASMQR